MAFERYTLGKRRLGPEGHVWKSGQIHLNAPAVRALGLEDFRLAVLFYERGTRRIGVMPTNDVNENGVLRVTKRNSGVWIFGQAFFRRFGELERARGRYSVRRDDHGEMIVMTPVE